MYPEPYTKAYPQQGYLHLLMTVLLEECVFTASDKARKIACDTYPLHREERGWKKTQNLKVQVQGLE